MLKCLYGLVKSIAITWITIKLLSLVPLLMSKAAQTVNDILASTKGSVAVVGSSSTVAWNIESLIDQFSLYGGATLLVLSIIATALTIRAHIKKKAMEDANEERLRAEEMRRETEHLAVLAEMEARTMESEKRSEVQAKLLKIALKKYPETSEAAIEELMTNMVEMHRKVD